jgi:hypothetical protein
MQAGAGTGAMVWGWAPCYLFATLSGLATALPKSHQYSDLCINPSTNIFDPYIYWVCWSIVLVIEYLSGLWGFVENCGVAGLPDIVAFTPTLLFLPSRAHSLVALIEP